MRKDTLLRRLERIDNEIANVRQHLLDEINDSLGFGILSTEEHNQLEDIALEFSLLRAKLRDYIKKSNKGN